MTVLDHTHQSAITALLLGRRVVKADGEHLVLDDGTTIRAIGHEGGCQCRSGDYDLTVLNGTDNIITRVEFDYAPDEKGDSIGCYRIFVFAGNEKINLMEVVGSDGNGYYGTGFELLVRTTGVGPTGVHHRPGP